MSENYEEPVALENQNQRKLDAILKELGSIQGKLKTLEELTHTQKEVVQFPQKKFVLRQEFFFHDLQEEPEKADEYCEHEDHFGASWYMRIGKYSDYLAVFIHCIQPENRTDWSVEFNVEIRINPSGETVSKSGGPYRFRESDSFGWDNLIDFNTLREAHLDKNDLCTVEGHVTIIKTFGAYNQILRSFDVVEFSDVALLVNEKKFYVSKLFLASQSNYFKTLFLGNFEESKKSEVKLCGVDENDMQKFLEVLYGENAIDDMTVEGVLFLSDMYGSSLAIQKCVSFLMKDSKKSLEKKLIISGKYNLEELKQQCFDKITTKEHIRSLIHGRHEMNQSILAVLLEKSLSLK